MKLKNGGKHGKFFFSEGEGALDDRFSSAGGISETNSAGRRSEFEKLAGGRRCIDGFVDKRFKGRAIDRLAHRRFYCRTRPICKYIEFFESFKGF